MTRYRKRPVEVDAARVTDVLGATQSNWDALPPWLAEAYDRGEVIFLAAAVWLRTGHGDDRATAERDDWIIRGVQGELYPCKPDIFEATYEAV